MSQPTVLELLSTAYRRLFDRATEVFARKDPVRAVWLFGSLASDRADEASDLDFQLAASDSHFEGFAADWRSWLAEITPTLIACDIPGAPGNFYCLTPTCDRMDVYCEKVSALMERPFRERAVLLDKMASTATGHQSSYPGNQP